MLDPKAQRPADPFQGSYISASFRFILLFRGCQFDRNAGTHQDAFAMALKEVGWRPGIATISVNMDEPKFAGLTKTLLYVPEKFKSIEGAFSAALAKFCERQEIGRFAEKRSE